MNTNELYLNLLKLCADNDAFFFKDFTQDGILYRIFNYRLATWSDFQLPGAIECRGIMYRLNADGTAVLVSRPMEKFFNDGENPSTIGLDYSDPMQVMYKEDGSLISTYLHKGDLRLKTKGSLSSEQAIDAMNWLMKKENEIFAICLEIIADKGYTVNMEWVSPNNRIVLRYNAPELVVLNIRDNFTGEYISRARLGDYFDLSIRKCLLSNWVRGFPLSINRVRQLKDIEGVVVQLKTGQHVKIKTDWYVELHRAKDSIDNPKSMILAVLSETTDDLRQLFVDMPDVLDRIARYEEHVSHKFNHIIAALEGFKAYMDESGDYTRKDYAIAAKDQWSYFPEFFSAQMNMLVRPEQSIEDNVKEIMMKNYKNYVLPEDIGFNEETV